MERNLGNINLDSLNHTIQKQIDNFILSVHVEFVKENSLKKTMDNLYQYLYQKFFETVKDSINELDWETIKPRVQSILHEIIKYWNL